MEKLESFLRKYSWLLKLGVFLLLVVWAVKLPSGISCMLRYEEVHKGNYDARIDRQIREDMRVFVGDLHKAIKDRNKYDPYDYFGDLRKIVLKERALRAKYNYASPVKHTGIEYSDVQVLRSLVDERMRRGENVTEAADAFHDWQVKEGFLEKDDMEKTKEEFNGWLRVKFLPWAVGFYLKGLLLSLILYLTRMANNDGIIKTILSGKKKFFLAVIFWPKLIFDYPEHIIREIHVEAELRRLGDKFRKLSPMEQRLVKEVAAKSRQEYREWIKNFQETNSGNFQRGLIGCVLVTLIVAVFVPMVPVFAGERNVGSLLITDWDPPPHESPPADAGCLPEFWEMNHLQEISRVISEKSRIIIRIFSRMIDCVPKSGCWVGEIHLRTN